MSDWKGLARQALRGALSVRRRGQIPKDTPVCVFDLAEKLNLEVIFCARSSFEGMYSKGSNVILVPSLRPPGRQTFTAGHEMGHWYFGHGSRIDELPENSHGDRSDPDEQLANLFSGYLLMPSWAVEASLVNRNLDPSSCRPEQLFLIACELGVGYETLVKHLRWSLGLIEENRATELLKIKPKQIRESIVGNVETRHLILTDLNWRLGNIDLQVGHTALLPQGVSVEGAAVEVICDLPTGRLIQGRKPGIARAFAKGDSWSKFLRVSRADFSGRSIYRHLEDPDVD